MQLIELIESYFADYRTHGSRDDEIMLCCPFCVDNGHSPDQEYKLGINLAKEIGHCHRCDWKGGGKYLFDALAEQVSSTDIYEGEKGHHAKLEKKKEVKLQVVKLPKTFEPLWKGVQDRIGHEAIDYLLKRGITEEQIAQHKIGFCAAGQYVHRIVFPVFYKKWVVGFTTRTFRNAEPKYLNSPGEKFLYNAKKKCHDRAILVEGPIDALSIEQVCSSDYDCIGRFGSSLTPIQLRVLGKYEEIVLWPDPDPAGVKGVIKIAKALKANTNSIINCIIPDLDQIYDPGAMEKSEIAAALRNVKPWSTAVIDKMLVRVLF